MKTYHMIIPKAYTAAESYDTAVELLQISANVIMSILERNKERKKY
jgi:hypothetical protein